MTVNVVKFREMGGGWSISYCSKNKDKLIAYCKERKFEKGYEIDTRNFNFEIDDVEQVYTIEADFDHMDTFKDCNMYYKTSEEAQAQEEFLNPKNLRKTYLTGFITVIK